MSRIIIVRHGNTFDPGDKVIRVGKKTNIPLSKSGRKQAEELGEFFIKNKLQFNAVYTSTLIRTIETANIALQTANINLPIIQNTIFDELDYGPDEGKTEEEIIARLGKPALKAWEELALVPADWPINPDKVIRSWFSFAAELQAKNSEQTVLVVTSNGIARFAPYLTGDFLAFSKSYKIKLGTGCVGSLSSGSKIWTVDYWNKKN